MSDDSLPIINKEKCTACGKCVAACPKQVIELGLMSKAVVISCHSRDKGIDVKKKCQVGCIACGICVRTCPVDAIKIDNNLARIDHSKCITASVRQEVPHERDPRLHSGPSQGVHPRGKMRRDRHLCQGLSGKRHIRRRTRLSIRWIRQVHRMRHVR